MRNTEAERAGALPEGEAIPEWRNSGVPPDADDPMAGLELPEDLDCLEDDDPEPLPFSGTDDALPCGGDDTDDPMAGLELPDDLDCLEDADAPDGSGPRYVKARTFERVDLPERPRTHRPRRKPATKAPGPTEAPEAPEQPAEEAVPKRPAPFAEPRRRVLPPLPPAAEGRACGCIFVVTGKEQAVADQLHRMHPEVLAVVARQEKHRSDHGVKSRVESVLFPGYVFFEAPEELQPYVSFPRENVIRVLTREDGSWQLMGEDEHFARWLLGYDGLLSFSSAYREGDRIRIVSGPLKDLEGCIRRIDRRGRSGQVDLEFNGRALTVWLGFELIDPAPEPDQEG